MRQLKDLLSELKDFGLKSELIQPGLAELGSDLAMPCFSLSRDSKLNPQQIAQQIAQKLKHPHIRKATAVNGYLNLWLSSSFLAQTLANRQVEQENSEKKITPKHKVIVEYFSPNLAKPFSVGHLRNLFQGRALSNLFKFTGHEVITDNHIGDWGTAFGVWVVGFLKYGDEEKLKKDGLKELGRIYVLITKDLKEESQTQKTDLKNQVQAWLLKLENNDEQAWRYHRIFSQISRLEMDRTLAILDIKFDENLGEAFYHRQALKLLKELEKTGLAQRQADQSLLVDLTKQGIDTPFLIQKSNGATLYATSDIATLSYRQQRWQPNKVIYVVGGEQKFHFKQLFAFNELAKLTNAELIHHAYGLVEERNLKGKRQKMSSRIKAVYLEDVLSQAYEAAGKLTEKESDPLDLQKIALGALIFQEFSHSKNHNILFDWQKIFSFSEMSGPYAQYATLRLKSILKKADVKPQFNLEYDFEAEHKLMFILLSFEDVLQAALNNLELSKIALHIFELCKELNRYYENTRVLDENHLEQASRLWLMEIIYQHLCSSLGILGVKIPSKM